MAKKLGRSKNLMSIRDEKLIRRYYELTEVQNLRFDRALTLLSQEEFFISESRIMAIIRNNYNKLTDIRVRPLKKIRVPKLTDEQLAFIKRLSD